MSTAFAFAPDHAASPAAHAPARLAPWRENPYGLVSLWDMLTFAASEFVAISGNLGEIAMLMKHGSLPDDHTLGLLASSCRVLRNHCEHLDLPVTAAALARLYHRVGQGINRSEMLVAVEEIQNRLRDELGMRLFFQLSGARVVFYDQQELFGKRVADKLPDASDDVRQAGTCFALARWTASVFHLMRAVEQALRAMAAMLNVPLPAPANSLQWGELLGKIEGHLDAMRTQPKSPQKTADLQRYSELAVQFRYMKDAWRNHVSHGKASYDEDGARKVMDAVRPFMQDVAAALP